MNYYFDESGNWQELYNEKNKLVIAGLLIKNKTLLREIEQELKLFKLKNHLEIIHANEMNNNTKEDLYQIISEFLKKEDIKVLAHYFSPKILNSQTIKSSDDLYVDIASNLISDITFGDDDINIEYDMKFHYAYPQNIIQNFKTSDKPEYVNMKKNFIIRDNVIIENKEKIKTNISRILNKKKDYELQKYFDLLSEKDNTVQTDFISEYLWAEFKLKIDKTNYIKDKFKDKIEDISKLKCKNYSIPYESSKLKIKYQHKHYQSAGVQIIDILCNLIWKFGNNLPQSTSSAIQSIYNNITIKDISNEI